MPFRAALALLLRRERLARADLAEDVARQLGDAAGQLAVLIAEEAAVIRIGRALRDAGQLERLGVVPARVAAAMADDDRMLRATPRRDAAASAGTSSLVSSNMTALTHWPAGVLSAFCLEVGLQLAHAADVGVDAVQLVDAAHVAVRVDESRRHGHLLGVDDPRARRREVADVGGRSDGDEAAVLDRERLGARQRRVDGVDARVDDDEVGFDAGPGPGRRWLLRRPRVEAARATAPAPASAAPKPRNCPRVIFTWAGVYLGTAEPPAS